MGEELLVWGRGLGRSRVANALLTCCRCVHSRRPDHCQVGPRGPSGHAATRTVLALHTDMAVFFDVCVLLTWTVLTCVAWEDLLEDELSPV